MAEEVKVTQRAREAAADYGDSIGVPHADMRRGECDDSVLVQAFASFEQDILADKEAAIQKARADALKPVEAFIKLHTTTDHSGHVVACASPSLARWQIFATAIRSLTVLEVSRGGEPKRVQLSRKKGWRMPPNTVKVDRTNKTFGNIFTIGCCPREFSAALPSTCDTAEQAVECFRYYAATWMALTRGRWIEPLRGKNLACWCKPGDACHADVLLELTNAQEQSA